MIHRLLNKYFLVTTLFLGLIFRLVSINQSLWMDEAISAVAAKDFSYIGIITDFIKSDTHPPLYYLILKFWSGIFGFSELALRLPSVVLGAVTIFVVYKIGKQFNEKVAIFASLLTTFSPLLIYYSQEVRMYALSTFLVSVCVYLFIKRYWRWFSMSLLLLGVTDYLPLLILMPLWVLVISLKKHREAVRQFALAHIPLLLFYALWFSVFKLQSISTLAFLNTHSEWGELVGFSNFKNLTLVWIKFLIGRINFSPFYLYATVVVFVSFLATLGLITSLKYYYKTLLFWLWFVLPIILSFALSIKVPGFSYFRLIFTLPALIIIISYGFSSLKKGNILFTLFLVLEIIFSCIYLFNQNFWREDWKTMVPFIENKMKPGEHVYVFYPESFTPYVWYANKPDSVKSLSRYQPEENSVYTLDYLKDLTAAGGTHYYEIEMLGYKNTEVYNFRGVGQVRYWIKN